MSRTRTAVLAALSASVLAASATAAHLANDTEGHTTVDQTLRPKADQGAGFQFLEIGPGEPYVIREPAEKQGKVAQADRETRRRSLAYVAQMTDFQLADEESPARVEFLDPGASSAHRPQEGLTPFQVDATIRQINRFAAKSPIPQGDKTHNAMDFALLTGDQADNQHLNETVWVRDLLEGKEPMNFNSGLTDPAAYAAYAADPSCAALLAQEGGAQGAADEGKRYTGVQDYDDYPAGAPNQPLYYDPDEPKGQYETWPRYAGLLDRAQEIVFEPEGLAVPFYITNGNHDVLVQGNEDANQPIEQIATGCFKALASATQPDSAPDPDPGVLLGALNPGMLVPPDPRRQFVSKPQIKQLYGERIAGDDDHGFAYVDPQENAESNGSASYYAWDPPQTPGMRFISIDTNAEGGQTLEGVGAGSSNGNIDDPQFQWLKRELQAARDRNRMVVIFGHHPVRSMDTQIRDEQAGECTGLEDEHGHDVNPGCDIDPRFSGDDPTTEQVECIHNGRDSQSTTCPPAVHESFVELLDKFPNVISYVPGHTHVHKLTEEKRTDGSTWWEINTSAVIDWPNQSRLIEWMDNRDGTLSIFNTVVDHASPATAPPGCPAGDNDCAQDFQVPELASIGRTLTYNDPDDPGNSGSGKVEDRNAELLLEDPRPASDLALSISDDPDPALVGERVTYTLTLANGGAQAHETVLSGEVSEGATITSGCETAGRRFTCNLNTLKPNVTPKVQVTVVPDRVGEISISASVRANVSDRDAGNDAARETTQVVAERPTTPTPTPTPGATPGATPTPGPTYQLPEPACERGAAFTRVTARPRGRRVSMSFALAPGAGLARVDVFQSSTGRRVLGERLVARFTRRGRSFGFRRSNRGRPLRDGLYFVRFSAADALGVSDVRRFVLRRFRGRWSRRPAFEKRASCSLVNRYKLERPAFGGTTRRGLRAAFSLRRAATVRIDVLRGRKVVKRLRSVRRSAGRTHRVRVDRGLRRRGDYRIRLTAGRGSSRVVRVLVSRRL
jgi:3',5'-cyclic AMP phosphodiesterase CpdA